MLERRLLGMMADVARQSIVSSVVFGLAVALTLSLDGSPLAIEHRYIAWVWFGALVLWSGLSMALGRRYRATADYTEPGHWRWIFPLNFAGNALIWSGLLFVDDWTHNPAGEVFVLLIMLGLLMVYLIDLSAHLLSFMASAAMLFIAAAGALLLHQGELIWLLRLIGPLFLVYLVLLGVRSHRRIVEGIIRELTMSELARDLSLAKEEVERESQAKSDFFSTISHELRTPLNAILGFAEIMRGELLGPLGHPRYKDYVDNVHQGGAQMLQRVEGLLDLAGTSGPESMKLRTIESDTLLSQISAKLARVLARSLVSVETVDGIAGQLEVDPERLATAVGGIGVAVLPLLKAGEKVCVGMDVQGGQGPVIYVHGIDRDLPLEQLQSLKDPFSKGNEWVAGGDFDAELSIRVVHQIAIRHGGRVDTVSRDGHSALALCLPSSCLVPATETDVEAAE